MSTDTTKTAEGLAGDQQADFDRDVEAAIRALPGLLAENAGRFVLVQSGVVEVFDTYELALKAGYEKYGFSRFLVKEIEADPLAGEWLADRDAANAEYGSWDSAALAAPPDPAASDRKLSAVVRWLEANQPDVFRRGLWEAIAVQQPAPATPPQEAPAAIEPRPDDLLTVADIEHNGNTLTMHVDKLGSLSSFLGEKASTYTLRIAAMKRSDFEELGDFDGF